MFNNLFEYENTNVAFESKYSGWFRVEHSLVLWPSVTLWRYCATAGTYRIDRKCRIEKLWL